MSYDQGLLFEAILLSLRRRPSALLRDLSRELQVSERTIQKVVSLATGKTFRDLRDGLLLEHARNLLVSQLPCTIKEVSVGLGYQSPSAFARAIKRASGFSPQQLRFHLGQARRSAAVKRPAMAAN
jgi:AraC-like DNA-binding protein